MYLKLLFIHLMVFKIEHNFQNKDFICDHENANPSEI